MEEQILKQPRGRAWKWILGLTTGLLLLTVAAYVLVFRVNRFSLGLQLQGQTEVFLEYGEAYEDPGACPVVYGTLLCKEGIQPKDVGVHVQNDVNDRKLGKYTVTYTSELDGLMAAAQRTVWVVDTQAPVITLTDSGKSFPEGTVYEEEGFVAIDNYDGDITHKVTRTETYGLVTYTVMDSAGNPACVERKIPHYDIEPPTIRLEEGEKLVIPAGSFFTDPGYTATDNVDGDLTDRVEVAGEVLWYQAGTYELSYSVTDGYENTTTVLRQVEVQAQPLPQIQKPQGKVIYLTFDDGPGPHTERLLQVLDRYDVKATFFLVNTDCVDLISAIAEGGHSLGIHSVTHEYEQIYASVEAYFTDLYQMQDIIYENTGIRTHLLRFPGGSSNTVSDFNEGIMTTLTQAVRDAGFRYFDWNVDSKDAGGAKKPEKVVENVLKGIKRQDLSVVLQHDIHDFSVDAVEEIILWGLENGYTFLPLEMDSPEFVHYVNN